MPEAILVSPGKHPGRVEGGRKGARRRWGPTRVVRIDDLTPDQRRLVLALIDAARHEEADSNVSGTSSESAGAEVRRVRDERSAS